jgi:hypothetical protein
LKTNIFSCDIGLGDVKFKATSKQIGAGFELHHFLYFFIYVDKLVTMYQFSDVDRIKGGQVDTIVGV